MLKLLSLTNESVKELPKQYCTLSVKFLWLFKNVCILGHGIAVLIFKEIVLLSPPPYLHALGTFMFQEGAPSEPSGSAHSQLLVLAV